MGDKIRLRWKHPEEDNGKRTKYVVKWYPSGKKDGKPQTMTLDPDTDEAFITTGLEPLRYYDFELVAATDSGEGEPWKQTNVVVGFADSKCSRSVCSQSGFTFKGFTYPILC